MSEALGPAGVISGGIIGNAVMTSIMADINNNEKCPWWDWRNYFKFSGEHTDLIDLLLNSYPNRSIIKNKLIITQNNTVPGIGNHYFYNTNRGWFHGNYITFNKVYNAKDGSYYYMCYVSEGQISTTFKEVIRMIFSTPDDMIQTVSLEKARAPHIYALFSNKFFKPSRPYQVEACMHILDFYDSNMQQCNVILCGFRGSGKSYTARVLKKELEARHVGYMARLFDNFDPMCPGMSYVPFVKQNLSEPIPAITLIDEIDECFERSLESENQPTHASFFHARDRKSMLELLDTMGDTRYSINMMTTELTPYQLYQNERWRSFIRNGRVNMFVHYVKINDEYTCQLVTHAQLESA